MTPDPKRPAPSDSGGDRTWDSARRQAVRGLEMTPAERLRWLEETMETMRRWVGKARKAPRVGG